MKKLILILPLLISTFLVNAQFGSQIEIPKISHDPQDIETFDLDNDGDLDVLVASSYDDKIAWFENLGGGKTGPQKIISTNADSASSVYAIDLDNDGDLDVLSASFLDNKIAWYENFGGGVFGIEQIISITANGATSVYAADLDNDGDIDVLSTSYNDGKTEWYENLGSNNFSTEKYISSVSTTTNYDVKATDLDNDGDLDIISAGNQASWNENLGGGIFGSYQILASGAVFVGINMADMDNDGDMDIIGIKRYWQYQNPYIYLQTDWYENLGGGNFAAAVWITYSSSDSKPCDIDNDGDLDIVYARGGASYNDNLAWRENIGSGIFGTTSNVISSNKYHTYVNVADMDNDGKIDIISSSSNNGNYIESQLVWQKNLGNNQFGNETIISISNNRPNSIASADIDNDGDMDVLFALGYGTSGSHKIVWHENFGNGEFGPQQIIIDTLPSGNYPCVKSADFDNDGDMDVLSIAGQTIRWHENLGGGLFGSTHTIAFDNSSFTYSYVYPVDIDNDGDMDVLSGENQSANGARVYTNLGGGVFSGAGLIANYLDPTVVYAADLDNDGDMDVISLGNSGILWNENLGTGFGPYKIINNNNSNISLHSGDIDGDGDEDIVAGSSNSVVWYENLGGGVIDSAQNVITNNINGAKSVFVEDFDGDGDMDVLSGSFSGGNNDVAWYENLGLGIFGPKNIISSNVKVVHAVTPIDIDGDGD